MTILYVLVGVVIFHVVRAVFNWAVRIQYRRYVKSMDDEWRNHIYMIHRFWIEELVEQGLIKPEDGPKVALQVITRLFPDASSGQSANPTEQELGKRINELRDAIGTMPDTEKKAK